ncbi:MAG: ATP-binding protein, partial [Aigarchaeota archaeon]|nr:ATP-binding protein [Aigarchaeota archaeon]
AVKARIDNGSLLTSVVTVTGSASMELLKQKELFPGRRGRGKDITMMPLGFHSYVKKVYGLEPMTIQLLSDANKAVEANRLYGDSLARYFITYLETGGFPLAIREMAEHGRVGEESRRALLDGLRSDWLRIGKSESAMKEVISYLLEAKAAPVSWLSISKNTSIASPNTVRSYVEVLEDLMVIVLLNYIEPNGKIMLRKNRKIHFTDPFIYRTLADYCQVKVDEDALVEGIVASHLSRRYKVHYWRNATEVDCVVVEEGGYHGFEVKWGVKQVHRPKWLRRFMILNRETIPLFLSSLPFA